MNTIEISGTFSLPDDRQIDFYANVTEPWHEPGRTYGDPYHCYPPESGGGEIVELWHDDEAGLPIVEPIEEAYPKEFQRDLDAALERWATEQADAEEAARETAWGI